MSNQYNNDSNENFDSLLNNVSNIANTVAQSSSSPAADQYDTSHLQDAQYVGYTQQEPAPFNINSIQLPPPQMGCYQPPGNVKGQVQHRKGQETNETKTIEQTLNDVKTANRDNVVHHQHVKNVTINVNRNHNHLVRLVTRDNNYHHHLINNVVRVNDTHNQRIEETRGEGRTTRDYKQTHRVELGQCRVGNNSGYAGQQQSSSSLAPVAQAATSAWQQQQQYQQQPQQQQQWQQQQPSQQQSYGSSGYNYGSSSASAGYRRY